MNESMNGIVRISSTGIDLKTPELHRYFTKLSASLSGDILTDKEKMFEVRFNCLENADKFAKSTRWVFTALDIKAMVDVLFIASENKNSASFKKA